MSALPINQPPPGVRPFVFTQIEPAATWNIQHMLGRPVMITLIDSMNQQMLAEEVHVNNDFVQIRFGAPESGRAIVI